MITGNFLITWLYLNGMNWEEGILFFHNIIGGWIQSLEKAFVPILVFTMYVQLVLLKLKNISVPNCAPSFQPRYIHVEKCYHNKILGNYNNWIIIPAWSKGQTWYFDINSWFSLRLESTIPKSWETFGWRISPLKCSKW